MALSNISLTDTFLLWLSRFNQLISISNNLTEGQANSTGTLHLSNPTNLKNGETLNVSNGFIRVQGNTFLANGFSVVSNSAPLEVTHGEARLGRTIYLSILTSSNTSDNSAINVASALAVNTVLVKALNINDAANAAFNTANSVSGTANAGFLRANAANSLASLAFDRANIANTLAATAFGRGNVANSLASAAFDKANAAAPLTTQGDILVRGASANERLARGAAGTVLMMGGSNMPLWASILPSGTKMLFIQTNAPTGWTKDTTHNNKALRVVNGTAGSGGSVAFTSAFTSHVATGTVYSETYGWVGATTIGEHQMPWHGHAYNARLSGPGFGYTSGGVATSAGTYTTGGAGGSQAHDHSWSGVTYSSFSGGTINLSVQYVDVIIATKD